MKKPDDRKISRRDFLKAGTLGVAALTVIGVTKEAQSKEISLKGKKLAMVIDLHRCTGCGGCTIACMNENNIQEGAAWAYRINSTTGKFPNVKYSYVPTLCNHCSHAPCVGACPTKAMHKEDGDITAHDPNKCIGCKSCMAVCPYRVITFNKKKTHAFWRDSKQLIKGCTESSKEVARKVGGEVIPMYNPDKEKSLKGSGLRYKGITEKCTFCDHRLKRGKLPYCVLRCPAKARIFGDLNDPKSKINEILGKYKATRLKEHAGTEPKIYYVREFNPANYVKSYGSI